MKEQFNSVAVATTMTSLQIAEVTGKRHCDVIRSIRSMEQAWEKVTERKFALSEYTDSTGRKLPMYSLTKTECLYVATKFNDEARAKLVLRWEALEQERLNLPTPEKQAMLFLEGIEAAQCFSQRLQRQLEFSERTNSRLIQKLLKERTNRRYISEEDRNFDLLVAGFDECCDLMWDCIKENNRLATRVAMLERKLGVSYARNYKYEEGGVL